MAVINPSTSEAEVPVVIYDAVGNQLLDVVMNLSAGAHLAFNVPERWPQTANRRGLIQLGAFMLGPGVPALSLRFNPTGAFTTVFAIPGMFPLLVDNRPGPDRGDALQAVLRLESDWLLYKPFIGPKPPPGSNFSNRQTP